MRDKRNDFSQLYIFLKTLALHSRPCFSPLNPPWSCTSIFISISLSVSPDAQSTRSLRAVYAQSTRSLRAVYAQSTRSLRAVYAQSTRSLRAVYAQSTRSLRAVYAQSTRSLRAVYTQSTHKNHDTGRALLPAILNDFQNVVDFCSFREFTFKKLYIPFDERTESTLDFISRQVDTPIRTLVIFLIQPLLP